MNKSLIEQLENTLKIVAASFTLIAILGLPAIYQHYDKYSLPISFIGYDQIIKAGVFPYLLLLGFLVYFNWAYRQFKNERGRRQYILIFILFLCPFFILPILVYILGAISTILVYCWAVAWVITVWALDLDVSNFAIISSCFVIIITTLLVVLTYKMLPRRLHYRILRVYLSLILRFDYLRKQLYFRRATRLQRFMARKEKSEIAKWDPPKKLVKHNDGIKVGFRNVISYSLIPIVGFLFLLLFLGLFLHILNFEVPYFSSWEARIYWSIFTVASVTICGSTFLVVNWLTCDNSGKRNAAFVAVIVSVAAFIFGVGYLYSSYIFAHIPQGLGGGKPDTVDVLISVKAVPDSFKVIPRNRNCHTGEKSIFCTNTQLLYHDDKIVVIHFSFDKIADRSHSLVLNRAGILAFSVSSP